MVAVKLKPHLRRELGVENMSLRLSLGRGRKLGEPMRM